MGEKSSCSKAAAVGNIVNNTRESRRDRPDETGSKELRLVARH
jgi:hypothetical protein